MKYKIVEITEADLKAEIASRILNDLPEWFGLPESTENYIQEGRSMPFWAAQLEDDDGSYIGFVNLTNSSADTGEVFCMGILKDYHRQGIGRDLMQALKDVAKESYEYLQVKTVDQGHYDAYDHTIAFYESVGFKRLEVFPTLWDEWNPCLLMIKKL